MEKGKILIVDDEADIREILQFNLENAGYEAEQAASAEEALEIFTPDISLILLDVMMDGMSGFKMAEVLRKEKDSQVPIIFLTARSAENDLLTGFSAGGDDYISKPFSPKILTARVDAILRRTHQKDTDIIKAGRIEINHGAHQVKVDGRVIDLSFKEFELLDYFIQNKNLALSREKILNNVWNYDYFGDARTIDTHVKKLRAKLGDAGEQIKTIWGMGYKFET